MHSNAFDVPYIDYAILWNIESFYNLMPYLLPKALPSSPMATAYPLPRLPICLRCRHNVWILNFISVPVIFSPPLSAALFLSRKYSV